MPSFSPELIQTMRAVLDEVITKIPPEQATPGIRRPWLSSSSRARQPVRPVTRACSHQPQSKFRLFFRR